MRDPKPQGRRSRCGRGRPRGSVEDVPSVTYLDLPTVRPPTSPPVSWSSGFRCDRRVLDRGCVGSGSQTISVRGGRGWAQGHRVRVRGRVGWGPVWTEGHTYLVQERTETYPSCEGSSLAPGPWAVDGTYSPTRDVDGRPCVPGSGGGRGGESGSEESESEGRRRGGD